MFTVRTLLVVLLGLSFYSASFAQEPSPQLAQAEAAKAAPEAAVKAKKADEGPCDCLSPVIKATQDTYNKLEEDEWPACIKAAKDTIALIKKTSEDCACPELIAYRNIAEAYLKYAEGGNHLDNDDETDCPYATKTYGEGIKQLKTYIPKVTDKAVQTNAGYIQEYMEEEKEFVDEECEEGDDE